MLHAGGAGEHWVHDPSLGHDDPAREPLVGRERVGEANAGQAAHVRQEGVAKCPGGRDGDRGGDVLHAVVGNPVLDEGGVR